MGDLYRALGQGEQAREAQLKSLEIRERLAQAEPDRADYQVDLAISLARVGMPVVRSHPSPSSGRSILLCSRMQDGSPEHESKITAIRKMLRKGGIQ